MTDIPTNIEGQNISSNLPPTENVAKTDNAFASLKTEPTLRLRESGAPPIDSFPKKVQPVLREAYAKAQDETSKASHLMDIGEHVVIMERAQQQGIDDVAAIANGGVNPEQKKVLDARLEGMKRELAVLKTAGVQISQGQDAPLLRNSASPFDDTKYNELFDKDEIDKYGYTRNVFKLAKRAIAKRRSDYSQGRETFMYRLQDAFVRRRGTFERDFLGLRIDMNYVTSYLMGKGNTLNSLNAISTVEPDRVSEVFSQGINETILAAQELAQQAAQRSYYLDQVSETFKNETGEVRLGIQGEDLVKVTSEAKTQHIKDIQAFAGWLRMYPKRIVNKVLQGLDPQIAQHIEAIANTVEPIEGRTTDRILEGASISLEMVELAESLGDRVERFVKQAPDVGFFAIQGTHALPEIKNRLRIVDQQSATSEEFPASSDTLWHTTQYEYAKELLLKGHLGSRKFQIDKFGEAVFLNEGIRVGKDYVSVGDQRMTKAEYDDLAKRNSRKNADKEQFQLAFEVNGPYRGGFDQARGGIAFIFGRPSLFSKAQFMQADGLHLFDPAFSWENQESAGFSVDLISEPMVLAVAEPHRANFIEFVNSELTQAPGWREALANPSQWINENVVFVPEANYIDPPKVREAATSAVSSANNLLNKKPHPQVQEGRFMPTGEQGQTAAIGVHLVPLFAYQSLAA